LKEVGKTGAGPELTTASETTLKLFAHPREASQKLDDAQVKTTLGAEGQRSPTDAQPIQTQGTGSGNET